MRFNCVAALLGKNTDDRRRFSSSAQVDIRPLPLPLRWQERDADAHSGSIVVGVFESLSAQGSNVVGSGYLLDGIPAQALEQIKAGVIRPSVDLAYDMQWHLEDTTQVVDSAKVLGATLVALPAFGDTSLSLVDEPAPEDQLLVASVFKPEHTFDRSRFAKRELTGPTRLQATSDGDVYGHIGEWGAQHRAFDGKVVTPPHTENYDLSFHTSTLPDPNGELFPVGRLTATGTHPEDVERAMSDTTTTWAYVRAYEDEWGIQVSGVLSPYADPALVHHGLSAAPSGAWKNSQLIAVLSVNTPGYPVVSGIGSFDAPELLVASFVQTEQNKLTDMSIARATRRLEQADELVREVSEYNREHINTWGLNVLR